MWIEWIRTRHNVEEDGQIAATGSDTGGSICAPAAANGIAGIKPTYGRVRQGGCRGALFLVFGPRWSDGADGSRQSKDPLRSPHPSHRSSRKEYGRDSRHSWSDEEIKTERKLMGGNLAQDHRTRFAEFPNYGAVFFRNITLAYLGACGCPHAFGIVNVLNGDRDAMQRTAILSACDFFLGVHSRFQRIVLRARLHRKATLNRSCRCDPTSSQSTQRERERFIRYPRSGRRDIQFPSVRQIIHHPHSSTSVEVNGERRVLLECRRLTIDVLPYFREHGRDSSLFPDFKFKSKDLANFLHLGFHLRRDHLLIPPC